MRHIFSENVNTLKLIWVVPVDREVDEVDKYNL